MKIIDVTSILVSSKYGNGNVFGQPKGVKSISLIQITTDYKDYYGIGETYAGVYSPELIPNVIKFLKAYIIGKNVNDSGIIDTLLNIPFISNNGLIKSVISGVEIALFDLLGKIHKKPIFKLLNPKKINFKKINCYASGGSIIFKPSDISRELETLLNEGYKSYKMRAGYYGIKIDQERIKTASKLLGKYNLMVDAIMGTRSKKWSLEEAIKFSKKIDKFNILWLEEPLNPNNLKDMSQLTIKSNVPIAFGESFTSDSEFENAILLNSCNYIQPDITHCGYKTATKMVGLARKKNMKIAMHVWGSPIALLANFHFAIAKNVDFIEIPSVFLEFMSKKKEELIEVKNGKLLFKTDKIYGLGLDLENINFNKFKFVKNSGFKI